MSYLLRLKTYLSPNVPKELYELVTHYLNKRLDAKIQLMFESQIAGPDRNKPDPFSLNQIDIGHFHFPFYLWLTQRKHSPVELLPVAPVFNDARAKGKPIYFSDVIVRRNRFIDTFQDLQGRHWGCGTHGSVSSYYSILQKLSQQGTSPSSFFCKTSPQENHLLAIQNVVDGLIDGAAVDSNVLALQHKKNRKLKHHIKIIETWGPFPIQPFVIRKGFDPLLKQEITHALKEMNQETHYKETLENYLVKGFADVKEEDFDEGKKLLESCKDLTF